MKHPVDTSTWGEFKVGELFDCQTTKTINPNKDGLSEGDIPYVTRSAFNNGISGNYADPTGEFTTKGNCITIGAEGAIAFYQDTDFIAGVKVYALRHAKLNTLSALFVCSVLNENARCYSYANARVLDKIKEETIPLPLIQGTNLADYTQEDIDWDYMERFMSRVQDAATERLANLPEPGQKSKTPVDTNGWGEFQVGELFDMFPGRRLKRGDFEDGDIPFVMASSYNNGVVTTLSNPISTNENFLTADIFGNVFYHKELVGYGDDNCGLKLKYREGSANEYLFLATMISSISVHASFTNKLRGPWYIEQTIKLPLKPSADPSNYTQDDIDWDYMEQFMEQFQKLAKNRVGQLTATYDYDILTV